MSERSRFVDELHALDARATRIRLAEAIAAVKAHPAFTEGPRGRVLQGVLSSVEADLLSAARAAVRRLDAALREADRPELAVPDVETEPSISIYFRRAMAAEREQL